jgi:predicted Zn-dependent protease
VLWLGIPTQAEPFTQLCMVAAVQVIVISLLDPIGLTTLLVEFGLGTALKYSSELPMSREHETEADELGLEIMARACYDVRQATGFFTKMSSLEESAGRRQKSSDWSSTHPSHPKRIANVQTHMTSAEVLQHRQCCHAAQMAAKTNRSVTRGWFSS